MYKAIKHIYLLDSFFSLKTVKRRLQREKCLFILKITSSSGPFKLNLLCFVLQQGGFAGRGCIVSVPCWVIIDCRIYASWVIRGYIISALSMGHQGFRISTVSVIMDCIYAAWFISDCRISATSMCLQKLQNFCNMGHQEL